MQDGTKIGELASRCGVSPDTFRFYEREGLLPAPRITTHLRARVEAIDQELAKLRLFRRLLNENAGLFEASVSRRLPRLEQLFVFEER